MEIKQKNQMIYSKESQSLFIEQEKKRHSKVLTLIAVSMSVVIFILGSIGVYVFFKENSVENESDNQGVDFLAFIETPYTTRFKMKSIHRDIGIKIPGRSSINASIYVFDIENKGVGENEKPFNFYGMTEQKAIVAPLKYSEVSGLALWENYNCRSGNAVLKKGEKSTICLIYPSSINSFLLEGKEDYKTVFRSVKIDDFKSKLTGYQKKINEQVRFRENGQIIIDQVVENPQDNKMLRLPITYTIKEKGKQNFELSRKRYAVELKNGFFVFGQDNSYISDANYISKSKQRDLIGEGDMKEGQEVKYYEVFDAEKTEVKNIYYLLYNNFEEQLTYYYEV